ncbi:MAG: zinc-binding dehydrogenase, partial [Deltaproteobacteria bacterium]
SLATRSLTLSRPNYSHFTATRKQIQIHARRLFQALENETLAPPPVTVYPLASVAQAHRDLEARITIGPLVLQV